MTIAVNTLRIAIAIRLYQAECIWWPLTSARLHCAAGIAVYFSALSLYYQGLRRIIGAKIPTASYQLKKQISGWLPWVWYVAGTVAVPATHQFIQGRLLPGLEYSLTVLGISFLLWGIGKLIVKLKHHRFSNGVGPKKEKNDGRLR